MTKIPILAIYCDNISDEPSEIFNVDVWRIARQRARDFVDAINRRGGDATLIELPQIGIRDNTHAPFAGKNNLEIADLVEKWLFGKNLDKTSMPYQGPAPLKLDKTSILLKK